MRSLGIALDTYPIIITIIPSYIQARCGDRNAERQSLSSFESIL
jgi:hypothetical protein